MKKDIVDLIKKIAQSIDDPMPESPRNRAPRTTSNKAPAAPTNSGASSHGFPATSLVKGMQQAILNFANAASSTDVTAMDGNKDGQMEGKQTRLAPEDSPQSRDLNSPEDNKKNYLGGSDPFGKFLVQNFINPNSFTGKQYLNVDVAGQTNRDHASINPANLRGIIDTIKRVGSPNMKGERTVDGVWQTRTNNALHMIGDLVEAILNLSKSMGIQLGGYNPEYLTQYKQTVPETWTAMRSSEDVAKRADVLTKHLNAMTKFIEQFNKEVINNSQIRKFIDQKEPFVSFPKEVNVPANMRAAGIPGVNLNWVQDQKQNWISLNDLSSLDNFKKFIDRTGYTSSDTENVKKILDKVSETINSKINLGF